MPSPQAWLSEQSPWKRRAALTVAVADAALRAWALADLARRDASEVRGPKPVWAVALTLANTVGVLPATYLLWGRHAD